LHDTPASRYPAVTVSFVSHVHRHHHHHSLNGPVGMRA